MIEVSNNTRYFDSHGPGLPALKFGHYEPALGTPISLYVRAIHRSCPLFASEIRVKFSFPDGPNLNTRFLVVQNREITVNTRAILLENTLQPSKTIEFIVTPYHRDSNSEMKEYKPRNS